VFATQEGLHILQTVITTMSNMIWFRSRLRGIFLPWSSYTKRDILHYCI